MNVLRWRCAILLAAGVVGCAMCAVARAGTGPASDTSADSTAAPSAVPFAFTLAPGESLAWGSEDGRAAAPSGIAIDDFGRFYVSDAAQHRLVRFDAGRRAIGQSGSLGSEPGRMRRPGSVAMLGTLSVAVLDRENRRILSYDRFGRLLGVLVEFEADVLRDALGRVDPVAMASDRGGAVYVADAERDRVLVFDFSGRFQRTVGGFGSVAGSFRGLRGIAVDAHGGLVTAERNPGRVQCFDPAGAVTTSWTIPAQRGREVLAVAADDSGRVAIADEAAGTLWLFDRDGRMRAIARDLGGPRAAAFGRDGSLWVAEATRGAVRRWRVQPAGDGAGDPRE